MTKATLILDTKMVLSDGRIVQRTIWQLPAANPERPHGLKYRLYCGKNGQTIVRYDNETGKGDHRHVGPREDELPYAFTTLARLLEEFASDIERLSGEIR
jgi:uncharacterized protein YwbE